MALITGALPAQYGLRTAGIIDIQTKTGTLDPGGSLTLYGGSQGWFQPSVEFGGRVGQIDYYVTGEILHNHIGIENPTRSYNPIHDIADQPRGFAYVSGIIDPNTRLTTILGASRSQFQIPNIPGLTPGLGLTVDGISDFPSAALDQNQRQINDYAIVTLQKRAGPIDFQVSGFNRYSSVYFSPGDPIAPILYTGIGQTAYRRSIATGVQGDGSWRAAPDHTVAQRLLRPGRTLDLQHQFERPAGRRDGHADQRSAALDPRFAAARPDGSTAITCRTNGRLFRKLTLNFGARFDLVDQFAHASQLSPRVNLVWQPTDTTTFTAGYSRYFVPPPFELIAPTTIGLFANTTAAPAITENAASKPERDHYFDVGVSQIILPGLKAGVDAYYKIASNLLDEGQFGTPIILTPFNYQKGLVRGVELLLTYDIGDWSFYGNFAAAKAFGKNINSAQFNFDPDELAYIANHYIHLDHDQTYTYSAGIKYRLPATRTLFSADLIAGSGLRATNGPIPNGNSLPSYQQVNLSIVQPVDTGIYKGLELRFDILNLFDQVYQIRNGSGVGVGNPQFGLRRTFLAGLTQRF